MKNKNLVVSTLLLSVGLVLHFVTPGLFGLMKPDFLCAMFFVALTLLDNVSEVVVVSVVCAVLSALTTSMPGGQIANIIDKLITGHIVFVLIKLTTKKGLLIRSAIVGGLGTIVSGILFLGTIMVMGLLPMSFCSLVVVVVLPTAIANAFVYFMTLNISLFKRYSSI